MPQTTTRHCSTYRKDGPATFTAMSAELTPTGLVRVLISRSTEGVTVHNHERYTVSEARELIATLTEVLS